MCEIAEAMFRVSESVKVAETPDGAVLLDIRQGLCFGINSVGALIWQLVGQGCKPKDVAQRLAETFHIPVEQAYSDVQEFLKDLAHKQLIQNPESTPAQSRRRSWFVEVLGGLWTWTRGGSAHLTR